MKKENLISSYIFVAIILFTFAVSNHTKIENRIEYFKNKKEQLAQQEINGVDVKLIEAIIHVESSGRPHVVSNKGAIGLMQIVFKWHDKRCGLSDKSQLFDPVTNVNCGTQILKHYLKKSNNNIREALVLYNGGYARPRQAYVYADKVLATYERLV